MNLFGSVQETQWPEQYQKEKNILFSKDLL